MAAAEPPPETTKLRLIRSAMCQAPQYVATELLHGEGFANIQEVNISKVGILPRIQALAAGEGDFLSTYVGPLIARIDAGDAVLVLSGLHAGCFRLYATKGIRSIRDLKGKTIAVDSMGGGGHSFLVSMASYVGLNPQKDINWVTNSSTEFARLLAEGKIDAYMDFPSAPQEPRPEKIGRMVLNSAEDRPWSQYFCCMVVANRKFVRKNPMATKRALRAILKAANICALEPDRTARLLVDKGFTKDYDYVFQRLNDIPYGKWRDYDPRTPCAFTVFASTKRG